jgi:hypothetical protein
MSRELNRREFTKLAAGACCAAGVLRSHPLQASDAPRKSQVFDYSGVKLQTAASRASISPPAISILRSRRDAWHPSL